MGSQPASASDISLSSQCEKECGAGMSASSGADAAERVYDMDLTNATLDDPMQVMDMLDAM